MTRSNGLPLVGLLAVALAACADEPSLTDPAGTLQPSFARSQKPGPGPGQDEPPGYLVVFKSEQGIPADFPALLASLGGELGTAQPEIGFATVTGLTAETAGQLASGEGILYVELDAIVSLNLPADPAAADMSPDSPDPGHGRGHGKPDATAEPDVAPASPGDPTTAAAFARQWNLLAIGAPTAWAAGRLGSPSVDVAILDTGIDYLYPDLVGKVDLSRSISLIASDDSVAMELFPDRHPVTDLHFHGTHVAATVSSNALVAAGVTSGVTLIGVKVLSRAGSGPFSGIIRGILHATDVGAEVINMSLGAQFAKRTAPGFVSVLNRALSYANRHGVTVVVAAGNEATDLDHNANGYHAFCDTPGVVCASATGPTASASVIGPWQDVDASAGYTNFGTSAINVAAPGGNTGGFVWAGCSTSSLIFTICQTGTFILGAAGTSMASPHVAGLAALLVEEHGRNPGRIKTALQQTADDLGAPDADPFYGKGRINVPQALGLN